MRISPARAAALAAASVTATACLTALAPTAYAAQWGYTCDTGTHSGNRFEAAGNCVAVGGAPKTGKIDKEFALYTRQGALNVMCRTSSTEAAGEASAPAKVIGNNCPA
ncbi:hypothetical protein [Nocardia australiensis]|uniref:hypothetical protein n=1 Tax=Nocardia australiensis TaxID=2887191 RepID=UPI001D13C486|nr:hypothetical protein [Nocardia australiensis]